MQLEPTGFMGNTNITTFRTRPRRNAPTSSAIQRSVEGCRTLDARTCIRNGRVIDPARNIDEITDVVVRDGKIESIGPCLSPGIRSIDATGQLVVPGLIDLHAHVYQGVTSYGLDPNRAGVLSGVTHVNDMGSSGWMTFGGLDEYVVKPALTNVTCFPSMSSIGMTDNWAKGATEFIDERYYPEQLADLAARHPEVIRGVKVWVERGYMSNLAKTWRPFEAARAVIDRVPINLYVHLGDLFPKSQDHTLLDLDTMLAEVVERMRPGEILGHCWTPFDGGLICDDQVRPIAHRATQRGLLHEVGHGMNVSFHHARLFLDAGLPVDIISSDVHGMAHLGTVGDRGIVSDSVGETLRWSMLSTMSKCLALGVPLVDVIRASTITPAKALGLSAKKGSLSPGFDAEISILDYVPGKFHLVDSVGAAIVADHVLLPASTIVGSQLVRCDPFSLPEFRNEYLAHDPEAFAAWSRGGESAVRHSQAT